MRANMRRESDVPVVARMDMRWIAVGMLALSFIVAGHGLGDWSQVHASHNTCGAIQQAGGEALVEAKALETLNRRLPQDFSGKVTVGHVPVTNDPIRVDVDAKIKKPAKNVDVTCASSGFSTKVDLRVKVSGKAGSSTHEGDGRITGHYFVYLGNPSRMCVKDLKMANLNLQGVQNNVDDWIRKKINDSIIVSQICAP